MGPADGDGGRRTTVELIVHPCARALVPPVAQALLDACTSPGPQGGSLPVRRGLESLLCSAGVLVLPTFPDAASLVSLLARASLLPGAPDGAPLGVPIGGPVGALPGAPVGVPAAALGGREELEEAGPKGMVLLCVEAGLPRSLHLFLRLLPAASGPPSHIFQELGAWLVRSLHHYSSSVCSAFAFHCLHFALDVSS